MASEMGGRRDAGFAVYFPVSIEIGAIVAFPKINGELARITQPVELKNLPSGKSVVNLNLAFNKRQKNQQSGEWEDAGTVFVSATAWDLLAENIGNSNLPVGAEVIVSGELSTREYGKRDGGKGTSLDLRLFNLGVSLAGATATPVKVGRDGAQSGGFGGASKASDDPWNTPAQPSGSFSNDASRPPF